MAIRVGRPPKSSVELLIHASNRVRTRYRTELSFEDIVSIGVMIQEQDAEFLDKGQGHTSIWLVCYKNSTYKVLYNHDLECVTTFLPLHNLTRVS